MPKPNIVIIALEETSSSILEKMRADVQKWMQSQEDKGKPENE